MPAEPSAALVYEYPLQERVRTYLRLETSLHQLMNHNRITEANFDGFFNALFVCQELIERSDVRGELIKDLEQQRQYMAQWQDHPKIDQNALHGALQSISQASDELHQTTRELRALKDDGFLASIRQRFAQPGISGLFELPQLQRWLSLPDANKQQAVANWQQQLAPLAAAIDLMLALIRQHGDFTQAAAQSGFWQESCEPLALLRIELATDVACYPVVSGHRQRFTIRFMPLPGSQDHGALDNIQFNLARCPLIQ